MDSSSLRLWIMIVGALFIAGIYAWGTWQERRTRRSARIEPEVGELEEEDLDAIPTLTQRRSTKDSDPYALDEEWVAKHPMVPDEPLKDMIIALGVLAPKGSEFAGGDLAQALRKAGMNYGTMNIFHAPADFDRPDGPALFSLANMLEPGTLEPERLRHLTTPGVLLFAQLPGAVKGTVILDHMYATGRFLAQELRGELCDERQQSITQDKLEEVRARILSEIGDAVCKPDFD